MQTDRRLTERFEARRPRLRAIAHRMLGSTADADDALQNAWLRVHVVPADTVRDVDPWLSTVVARECLRILRARRTRGEQPWSDETEPPASVEPARGADPELSAVTAEAVGAATLMVLDTLGPVERVALVLHDVLDVPFAQVAPVVGRSVDATRQLTSRARHRARAARPRARAEVVRQRRVVDALWQAVGDGDADRIVRLLSADVVLVDDAGPTRHGPYPVAEEAASHRRGARFARLALVDGRVGLALVARDRLVGALGFTSQGDRLVRVDMLSTRAALRRVALVSFPGA